MICSANQWTGFYMITASIKKELKRYLEKQQYREDENRNINSCNTKQKTLICRAYIKQNRFLTFCNKILQLFVLRFHQNHCTADLNLCESDKLYFPLSINQYYRHSPEQKYFSLAEWSMHVLSMLQNTQNY